MGDSIAMSLLLGLTNLMRFCVGTAVMAVLNPAEAAPANPGVMQIQQVGGGSFDARARGDEYQGWLETTDGHTIIRNASKGGRFDYAVVGSGGVLVPSGIQVTTATANDTGIGISSIWNNLLRSISVTPALPPKGLRPPRNTGLEREQEQANQAAESARLATALGEVAAAPAAPGAPPSVTGVWSPRPVSGEKKLLVILVNFVDAKLTTTPEYWSKSVFSKDAPSVASFYRDNSYGKVTIVPVSHTQPTSPAGVVVVSLNENNPNYGNGIDCRSRDAPWVGRALAMAASFVDFSSLDVDGDGSITVDEALVYFVLAGYESAAGSGGSPAVWAHRCASIVGIGAKKINNFALSGELYSRGVAMRMGIIAHEMGHAMAGLPDLYDTSNTNAGLGAFSVMSFGMWGARSGEIRTTTPVGMDAWSRQYLGWSSPRTPVDGKPFSFSTGLKDPSSAVMLMNAKASTTEYWLVENRTPTSWDEGLFNLIGAWKGGLLIQHIDATVGNQAANTFNTFMPGPGHHQGNLAVQPSTAQCDLMQSDAAQSCPSILFYAGNSTAYDDASTPPSHYYRGTSSTLGVMNISAPSSAMTATLTTSDHAGP
jgi:M6 family metalloprotease-like protein